MGKKSKAKKMALCDLANSDVRLNAKMQKKLKKEQVDLHNQAYIDQQEMEGDMSISFDEVAGMAKISINIDPNTLIERVVIKAINTDDQQALKEVMMFAELNEISIFELKLLASNSTSEGHMSPIMASILVDGNNCFDFFMSYFMNMEDSDVLFDAMVYLSEVVRNSMNLFENFDDEGSNVFIKLKTFYENYFTILYAINSTAPIFQDDVDLNIMGSKIKWIVIRVKDKAKSTDEKLGLNLSIKEVKASTVDETPKNESEIKPNYQEGIRQFRL